MNILWFLLSCALGFGVLVLLVFLLSFDGAFAKWLGRFFWRGRLTISVMAGTFLLFTAQEVVSVKQASERHRKSMGELGVGNEARFFHLAEMFRSQRNMYMVISGFVVYLAILLISYQVHSWTDRINNERQRLRKTE